MQLRKWFQSPRRRNYAIFILLAAVGVVVYRVYAAPTITIDSPATGVTRVKSDAVTYTLNNATGIEHANTKITWTWESGSSDGLSPHVYPILAANLTTGQHTIPDTTQMGRLSTALRIH